MGIPAELRALYTASIGGDNARQVVYPATGTVAAVSDAAAAADAWSAYVQIVAAAAIADPCWLVGVHLHLPVVEAFYGVFQIATGEAASEVPIAEFPFDEELFAVVEGKSSIVPCFAPIRITGSPRLSVRLRKDTGASAAGCSLEVICLTGLGA